MRSLHQMRTVADETDADAVDEATVALNAFGPRAEHRRDERADAHGRIEIADRVRAAVRIGDRRWDIHMDEKLHVMLPEDDPVAAWHRLAELARTGEVFARNYSLIDLRLKDRVVVRKAPNEDQAVDPKQRHT